MYNLSPGQTLEEVGVTSKTRLLCAMGMHGEAGADDDDADDDDAADDDAADDGAATGDAQGGQ